MPLHNTAQPTSPPSTSARPGSSGQASSTTSVSSPLHALPASSSSPQIASKFQCSSVEDAPATPVKHDKNSGRGKAAKASGLEADIQEGIGGHKEPHEMGGTPESPRLPSDEVEEQTPIPEKTRFRIAGVDNWEDYYKEKAKWEERERVKEGKATGEVLDHTWDDNERNCAGCECCSGEWDEQGFDYRNNFDKVGRGWKVSKRTDPELEGIWREGEGDYERVPALLVVRELSGGGMFAVKAYEEIVSKAAEAEAETKGKHNVERFEAEGTKESLELTIPGIKELIINWEAWKGCGEYVEEGSEAASKAGSSPRTKTSSPREETHDGVEGFSRDVFRRRHYRRRRSSVHAPIQYQMFPGYREDAE